MATFERLRELKDGWDGYDAPAPDPAAIDAAEWFAGRYRHWDGWLGDYICCPLGDGGVWLSLGYPPDDEGSTDYSFHNDGTFEVETPEGGWLDV